MPVMSGEETLVRLKDIRSEIPVVLSSGYNEADATRRFTDKGLAGFIQKPYTAAGLAEKMKIALEFRAAARCRARGARLKLSLYQRALDAADQ